MSDNSTQAKNLNEKNTGDSATEFDNEKCANDSILNSHSELANGQRSPQPAHSSRKRSHSHSENTNLQKGKQPRKKTNLQPRMHDLSTSKKQPCHLASDNIPLIERKIEKSEQSISKLKTHMDKGTSPKDLCYVPKANTFPHEEFKSDLRAVRKEAEQKTIGALTIFHYPRVERSRDKLRRATMYTVNFINLRMTQMQIKKQ